MLREIRNVRQNDPHWARRWFRSDYFDLFLWFDASGRVMMMQLCYSLLCNERALTWKEGTGFYHDGVDDGEGGGAGINSTSVLVSGGSYTAHTVNARFMQESVDMPIELRKLVLSKLHQYSVEGPARPAAQARRTVRREDWRTELEQRVTAIIARGGPQPPAGLGEGK